MLNRIPDKYFEMAGTFFGLLASVSIASQIYAEYSSDATSTISPLYAAGFLIIFVFWTFYGIRFKRPALWITNGIAVITQALLLITITLH
jgi:uncharacterized protein with PQ loop repeat